MKIISCILLFLFVAPAYGQSALRQRIDFQAEEERFEDVMLSLAEAGQFSFSYNPALLPVDSIITIDAHDTPIKNILTSMLGQELEVRQSGNHLVILRTQYTERPVVLEENGNSTYTISGQVRNSRTGNSIPNATVFEIKSLQSAVTGPDGQYTLEIPSRHTVIGLSVLSSGIVDTTLVLENKDRQVNLPIFPTASRTQSIDFLSANQINERSIVRIVASEEGLRRNTNASLSTKRTAQISFVPFIGTNQKVSGIVENRYSFNVLAGYNGAVEGVEVGGLVNIDRFYMHGVQFAGLANVVGKETKGLQIAGLFNTNLGSVNGVQFAGINNLVLDSLKGLQVAGVINIIQGRTDGVQFAGVTNVALKNVDGFQFAGVGNFAIKNVNKAQFAGVLNFGKDIDGGQIAGVMNTSYGRVGGIQLAGVINSSRAVRTLQMAGVMNVAIDSVNGAQIASVFNFARKNHGFQLGLVNAGDTASGFSLGLLSVYLRGYNKLELYTNEVLPYSARVKIGANRKFYNILGLGTQGFTNREVWGYTYGMGTAIGLGRRKLNMINIDLTATDLQDDDSWFEDIVLMGRLGIFYGQHIGKRFMIFAGPVWSNLMYESDKADDFAFIEEIVPSQTLYRETYDNIDIIGWAGFEVGLRFF